MEKKITFLIPSMRGGGAEKVNMLLANELSKKQWEVTILLCELEGPYLSQISTDVKLIQLSKPKISGNILEIKKYLDNNEIDIFYSSMNFVNIVACISYKLSNSKAKLFISEHNDISEVLKNASIGLRFLLKNGIKYFYKYAFRIVCVSKGVEKALNTQFELGTKTCVIYNPIEQFQVKKHEIDDNSFFRILSIGRLSNQKNFSLLIDAFFELKKIIPKYSLKLTILGEGPLRPTLETKIKKMNLVNDIVLPGFADVADYFSKSDLFVLSSNREGFGNVIVEALSAGLPVISTNCPSGPSEILDNGAYGILVETNEVKDLRDAMHKLVLNPNLISNTKERQLRASEFSPENIVDVYEQLFLSTN